MSAALRMLAALAAGPIFGLGLSLSGMLDPTRVQSLLDVTGAFAGGQAWDPTLKLRAWRRGECRWPRLRSNPAPTAPLALAFELPTNRRIDRPLIGGAALFGIHWGLSGLCPDPAVAAMSTGTLPVAVFVAAILAGMAAYQRFVARA